MFALGNPERGNRVHERIPVGNRIPEYDPRSATHYWAVVVAFGIQDPEKFVAQGEQALLDHESVVQVSPIACLYCSVAYSKRENFRRCTNTIPD